MQIQAWFVELGTWITIGVGKKYALVSFSVDFETIDRGHGIFKCPSELHHDPSYQKIIESMVKKWLIDSQPESDEKKRLIKLIDWTLNLI